MFRLKKTLLFKSRKKWKTPWRLVLCADYTMGKNINSIKTHHWSLITIAIKNKQSQIATNLTFSQKVETLKTSSRLPNHPMPTDFQDTPRIPKLTKTLQSATYLWAPQPGLSFARTVHVPNPVTMWAAATNRCHHGCSSQLSTAELLYSQLELI